jgi:hypothetical protein
MNGKETGSHEGEGRRVRIDFGREDASDGRASCAATNDYDALAGHCMVGLERRMRRKEGEGCSVFGSLGGLSGC